VTLPEQSDRAVAATREFLVRLASPYGEGAIKGIRREIRAEALALLRHYPYSYRESDEKRGNGDTEGATVPSRCTLTTERIECETSVSRPVSERLSLNGDFPEQDNVAKQYNLKVEVRRLEGAIAAGESKAIANCDCPGQERQVLVQESTTP
jgi:hypothetical protein